MEKSNTLHLKILRSNDEYYFKKEYNFPFKMKKKNNEEWILVKFSSSKIR